MRKALKAREGIRTVYTATCERFGRKTAYKGPPVVTLCMIDVRDSRGERVADHLWFSMCKAWHAAGVKPGDRVQFTATARPYTKGYRGRRDEDVPGPSTDWKLAFPGDVRVLCDRPAEGDGQGGQLTLFPE